MPFGRVKRTYRAFPLWLKLTLSNTLVVLFVVVTALIGVREGLRVMLQKELEIALRDEVYEIALNAHRPYDNPEGIFEEMAKTSAGHIRHGWFLQLHDDQGRECLWASPNTPDLFRSRNVDVRTKASVQHFERHYVTQLQLEKPGLPVYWVRLGTSTEFIEEDVQNVTEIILPILGVLLLLAPLVGYFLAARATAPLKRIISTAEKLRPRHLSERLEVRGTGDELDQLSQKINRFLDEIADHLVRTQQFVTDAAHELRSPLAAIESTIDVSLTRARTPSEYQELLTTVQDQCHQLSHLVKQLLLLAEGDVSGTLSVAEEVDLAHLVRTSIDMFSGVAEEKQVTIITKLADGIGVRADAGRVRQVVTNLLDNALKFTPAGGNVFVSLQLDDTHGNAILSFEDTGIGIPPESLPRLFDRFYRVDQARHRGDYQRGNGLGLSICQAIVHSLGGEIRATSQLEDGSNFVVTLPAKNESWNSSDKKNQ